MRFGEGLAIERTPVGVGDAEVDRRSLTEVEIEAVVPAEMVERPLCCEARSQCCRRIYVRRTRAEYVCAPQESGAD